MRDENSVLQERERAIARVRREIEALHLAIPLLAENRDWVEHGLALPPPGTGTSGLPRRLHETRV
jgi:hypothetical protein